MMKPKTFAVLIIAAALILIGINWANAQSVGSFTTTLAWTPSPSANAGYRLFFGTGASGAYSTNHVVPPGSSNFVFQCQPNTTYRSAIQSMATDGRTSVLSAEIVWTTPPLLTPPGDYRAAAIVYVP